MGLEAKFGSQTHDEAWGKQGAQRCQNQRPSVHVSVPCLNSSEYWDIFLILAFVSVRMIILRMIVVATCKLLKTMLSI